jgi:hypothetical protein
MLEFKWTLLFSPIMKVKKKLPEIIEGRKYVRKQKISDSCFIAAVSDD